MKIDVRPAALADETLLREYLYLALFVPPGDPPLPRNVIAEPALARYIAHWGRPGDRGLVAVERGSGDDVGAAWLRLWPAGDTGYGFLDYHTPELSMAVRPGWRGQGIGTLLLQRVLTEADERYEAVSLSVANANPAIRLYKRCGFESVVSKSGTSTMQRLHPARQRGNGSTTND